MTEKHDYERGETTHPMATDPNCLVCGETRSACERRREPEPEAFSVRDGLAWLGISLDVYEKALAITAGRHGNPISDALLDARAAQENGETRATVLARNGIDPNQPLAAAREYDNQRSRFDDT